MKAITRYLSDDGSTFNIEADCIKYERLSKKVDKLMKGLGKEVEDEGCEFGNGGWYVQHDKQIVKKAKENIVILAKKELKIEENYKFGSFIGRYIDDSGVNCIKNAYSRLQCIDIKGREWGQPYFAFNPNKGVQKPYKGK